MRNYSIAPMPQSCDEGVRVWARWILRATSGEHYVCRAFDSLPKLRRYVRALRTFGFHNKAR